MVVGWVHSRKDRQISDMSETETKKDQVNGQADVEDVKGTKRTSKDEIEATKLNVKKLNHEVEPLTARKEKDLGEEEDDIDGEEDDIEG